jgi:putative NIF3 family GTP cyclohydrolase 1 type 2
LGLDPAHPFGFYREKAVGFWAEASVGREALKERLSAVVGHEARVVPGGPDTAARVGVLTGGGSGFLAEASSLGLDTLVTGEAPHHAFHDAMEMGINLILGGHYATETLGVRALGQRLAREFPVSWEFLDYPTGF